MAREFSRAMEDAAEGTGVKEAAQDFRDLTSKKSLGLDTLEQAASNFEKWEPKLPSGLKAPNGSLPAAAGPEVEVFDEAASDAADMAAEASAEASAAASAAKRATKAATKAAAKPAVKSAPKADVESGAESYGANG